jgi:hypothetical protein
MDERRVDFGNSDHLLDGRRRANARRYRPRLKAADEGRLIPAEDVRRRIEEGLRFHV